MRVDRLRTVFTAEIPETLDDGVLYVSRECRVALHNCACGCGEEVSTPLVATEYRLTMHGDDASLWPSIGNHDFACASHYVIHRGMIVWANKMSRAAIEAGREKDRLLKRPPAAQHFPVGETGGPKTRDLYGWLKFIFRKFFN
nr:DUF6527 family protein [Agrobacterium deltaense]